MRTLLLFLLLPSVAFAAPPSSFSQAKRIAAELHADHPQTFYCGCSYVRQGKKLVPDLEGCDYQIRKSENRAQRVEWEHVVPAWAFGHQRLCWQQGGRKACKKEPVFRRMEADLHNLRPAIGENNGDRSNFRFAMLEGEERRYGSCDFEVDFKGRKAEPRPEVRGDIARTYFYMRDQYGLTLSKQQEQLLEAWSRQDAVDEQERALSRRTAAIQGNGNPYVVGAE
jgi:deoxyribonuclease-1